MKRTSIQQFHQLSTNNGVSTLAFYLLFIGLVLLILGIMSSTRGNGQVWPALVGGGVMGVATLIYILSALVDRMNALIYLQLQRDYPEACADLEAKEEGKTSA